MNYEDVKRIREKISCPQLGDDHYGEWGALNLNQRIAIKELLDFIDAQESYIKSLQAKIEEVREAVEKQIPKKSNECKEFEDGAFYNIDFMCPACNNAVIGQPYKPNYCKHCGQALDWSDIE